MAFRYYSNFVTSASKNVAAGIFVVGLLLIGFGFLVWVLKELFAILAAVIFSIAGVSCIGTAIRIYLASRRMDRQSRGGQEDIYRDNVRIHRPEDDSQF